ncbi:Serine/threonine-protein kinase wnk4 [Perkinsus chesapeaki]|uniref:Serine/threonine-protein kinase wnk4 n=1 Tax=Perkinsus chesapeaki TaxID=330153 RepID=A0A7J6N2H9_PERCH|nr:Serine/threonine-protein kinase wnk4 [Perkinsus chesapeaki]
MDSSFLRLPQAIAVDPSRRDAFCLGPFWCKTLLTEAQLRRVSVGKTSLEQQCDCIVALSQPGYVFPGTPYRAAIIACSDVRALSRSVEMLVADILSDGSASTIDDFLVCVGSQESAARALEAGGAVAKIDRNFSAVSGEIVVRVSADECGSLSNLLGILCGEVMAALQVDVSSMVSVLEADYEGPMTRAFSAAAAASPSSSTSDISVSFLLNPAEFECLQTKSLEMVQLTQSVGINIQAKQFPCDGGASAAQPPTGYLITLTGNLEGVQTTHRRVIEWIIRAAMSAEKTGLVELLKLPASTIVDSARVPLFCQGPYWFKILVTESQVAEISAQKASLQAHMDCAIGFSAGKRSLLGRNYHALMVATSNLDSLGSLCRELVEGLAYSTPSSGGIFICLGSDQAVEAALNAGGSAISPQSSMLPPQDDLDERIICVLSKACAGLPSVVGILCKEIVLAVQSDKAAMMKILEIEYPMLPMDPATTHQEAQQPQEAHSGEARVEGVGSSFEVPRISISLPLKEAEANELVTVESSMRKISHDTETFIQLKHPRSNTTAAASAAGGGDAGCLDGDASPKDLACFGGYVMTLTGSLNGVQEAHRKVVAILIQAGLNSAADTKTPAVATSATRAGAAFSKPPSYATTVSAATAGAAFFSSGNQSVGAATGSQ